MMLRTIFGITTGYCPVTADLNRHLAEEDLREARYEAILEKQNEILDDLDDLEDLCMSRFESVRFYINLNSLVFGECPESREHARKEMREIVLSASRRLAEKQLDDDARQAAEDRAADLWSNSNDE
jgi:hypothetical protein